MVCLAERASLAKWLSVHLQTKWLWVRVPMQSLKKNVVILPSSSPMYSATKDDQKFKPQIFKFYDFTKSGTDIVD